jgi:hypothetical protein
MVCQMQIIGSGLSDADPKKLFAVGREQILEAIDYMQNLSSGCSKEDPRKGLIECRS